MIENPFKAVARGVRAALTGRSGRAFPGFRTGAPPRPAAATDQLILALSADLRPVTPTALGGRLAVAGLFGGCVALLCLDLLLGSRPGLALGAAKQLSRPGARFWIRRPWMALPIVALFAAATGDLLAAPVSARMGLVMGRSAFACLGWIMLSSLAPLWLFMDVMRRQATTRPALTGAVLGVGAGGVGAAAYAFRCTETATPFVCVWYALGVIGVAFVGAAAGSRLLRW